MGHGQHTMKAKFPHRRTPLQPAAQHGLLAALRRCRLRQLQELHPGASERHSCPLRPRRLVRRRRHEQGMATTVFGRMGRSRRHGRLRQKPGVDDWLASLAHPQRQGFPGFPRCRDGGRGELFTKHITPEPAEEGSPVWAMAEESDDDEDGTPPHADADEPELIAMPLARGIRASRILRWTALTPPKNCHLHRILASLSVASRVGCLVCCAHACVSMSPRPDHQSPGSQAVARTKKTFFFLILPSLLLRNADQGDQGVETCVQVSQECLAATRPRSRNMFASFSEVSPVWNRRR